VVGHSEHLEHYQRMNHSVKLHAFDEVRPQIMWKGIHVETNEIWLNEPQPKRHYILL
jgi:hypothetical protein